MRFNIIVLLSIFLFTQCKKEVELPISATFNAGYKIDYQNAVQDKNFFLLSMIQRTSEVKSLLQSDATLSALAQKYVTAFKAAKSNCNGQVSCIDQLLQINNPDINQAAQAFAGLVDEPAFRQMIQQHLRPSGMFIRYDSLSDATLLENVWRDAAKGMNNILKIYGLGENPRYAEIDKVSYEVDSEAYQQLIQSKFNQLSLNETTFFFEPALKYAMGLLDISNRDEAGRYEPMYRGENKAAIDNLKNINWEDYEYSLILVLGDSPNSPGDLPNISIGGMARADHGMQLFQQQKAPLLVFSGGHVRPFQTEFSEAVEMKKYVMEKYGIPENQILIDPHARHTTTNLRNVSRLVFRHGIPADKKVIVSTSTQHSQYVTSQKFHDRCLNELGYLPAQLLDRLNNIDVEFFQKKPPCKLMPWML